jgi:hypothetical protein
MTELLVGVLLALAAISLGLRVTNTLIPRAHPWLRLTIAAIVGSAASTGLLEICDRYQVHDLGLGLLVSLAPVGIFDLLKWWFRWKTA